jgi:uncharacterized protein (DUF433 family)
MSADVVIATFSEEQAERLTGLSRRQLRHWDSTGFLVPTFADEDRSNLYSRVYSFLDIVALRTLGVLRRQYGISLQHLRRVAAKMREMDLDVWTGTTLYVLNRGVIFEEPGTGKPQEIASGQYVLPLPLQVVVSDTRAAVADLWRRPQDKIGHVEHTRNISANYLVVAGTRVRVSSIKRLAEDGYTIDQIRAEYPQLTADDVKAALAQEGTLFAA